MKRLVVSIAVITSIGAQAAQGQSHAELTRQVQVAESSFAATMAQRNHAAFTSFLDHETVFFGRAGAIRGKDAVAADWKAYFEGDAAPFSWRPEVVEVLDSGTLGLTSGPVFDPAGRRIGTFTSVWRRETGGAWKIIFDKGCPRIAGT
jgi:ketosteroid isomerase-like protein